MRLAGSVLLFCALLALQQLDFGNARIVNGTNAAEGEFPFIVSLQRVTNGRHFCGASIINPRWILTAAHCVVNTNANVLKIQYGSTRLNPNSRESALVSRVYVHPRYAPNRYFENDIALLRLATAIPFGPKVAAVRLPRYRQQTAGNLPATLMGWGLNATGGTIQNRLQKVRLQTFSDAECSRRYGRQLYETNICAGVPEGGKGQCSGDSGGPLIVNNQQVGIVSYSQKPCTIPPYPGVFTEVSYYTRYIFDTIDRDPQSQNGINLIETISGGIITTTRRSIRPEGAEEKDGDQEDEEENDNKEEMEMEMEAEG